jgi:hypothetical protein
MPLQIVTPDEKSPAYGTPDEAANEVSKSFKQTPDKEQAAVLFQRPDGKHVYSTVAPSDSHDNFGISARMPKDWRVSAVVHSHPGEDANAALFSPRDVEVAHRLNVPSYIRFLNDDSIRKYTPGVTSRQKFIAPFRPGAGSQEGFTSKGDPIVLPKQPAAQAPVDKAPDAPPAAPPTGSYISQAAVASRSAA